MPSRSRIAAAATEPMCARAPAPSVTLTASARPFNGAALAIRSAASHDTGGAISAVMTNLSVASFSLRVGIAPFVLQFLPRFKRASMGRTAPCPLGAARAPPIEFVPMPAIARTLDEALAPITDGCVLAVPRESSGRADGGDAGADPPRRQAAAR